MALTSHRINLISRVVCAAQSIWTLKNPVTCLFTASHLLLASSSEAAAYSL